ncbi:hypothetical protein [Paraburkholderia fungorum]|jgi:hypothetical protein|uniref:hypothetical protein n=1 Tax=Paraburkholderia fungorum TaxID=134537 RepID=UPI000D06CA90|nr:hypothetical protein [Paraburkholderia fungorum]PRZ45355.1 hypothetical protein BX589_13934 [Paraburkholderia fungorum]
MLKEILAYCGEYKAGNLKILSGREGQGFECMLVKGERVIGKAVDYGDGACLDLEIPVKEDHQALLALCNEKYPEFAKFGGAVDSFIGNVFGYWDCIKSLKSKCKKKVLAVDPATTKRDEQGVPVSYHVFSAEPTEANLAAIRAKYPTYTILNDELATVEVPKVKVARR